MPLHCVAYGCTNHNLKANKPGFFRFPNNNEELRKKWVKACRRKNPDGSEWNPQGKNVYICGEHFNTGRPHKKDPNHPDYVPSIFTFNQVSAKQIENKIRRYEFVCRKRLGVEKMTKKSVNVLTNKETLVLDNSAGVNNTVTNNTVLHGDISEHSAVTPSHSTTTDSSADYVSSFTELPILPCGTDA
jgi:hypothetical protein